MPQRHQTIPANFSHPQDWSGI